MNKFFKIIKHRRKLFIGIFNNDEIFLMIFCQNYVALDKIIIIVIISILWDIKNFFLDYFGNTRYYFFPYKLWQLSHTGFFSKILESNFEVKLALDIKLKIMVVRTKKVTCNSFF